MINLKRERYRILELMDIVFPPGNPPTYPGPLARFLPPLDEGSVNRLIQDVGSAGDLVFDPFGASPRLVREAAASNRAVIVAVNNPVTRFVLQAHMQPFNLSELQTALAALASARKDGSRLEPFMLDLYRSWCSRCGEEVTADYFVWEKELDRPILKAYFCSNCNHTGEDPVTARDIEYAQSFSRRGLQHALALETVTPTGDRHRRHAEAALAVYPGRALYALITLTNKINQLALKPRINLAVQALMLSAFDATNALWIYPEGRARPKQLSASTRYREVNVWRALERGVEEWALPGGEIPVVEWSKEHIPEPGSVAVFAGPLRELISDLPRGSADQVLTVVPRPNQAYWTLSALWASWLWGREAAAPIKVALSRRRYDWNWHAGALRSVLSKLRQVLTRGTPVVSFVTESEPGFIAATIAGFDGAGFYLTGRALRFDTGQAVFLWESTEEEAAGRGAKDLLEGMRDAIRELLRERAEPTRFPILHAAVWTNLAKRRHLPNLWQEARGQLITKISAQLERALSDWQTFTRLDRRVEPETGLYWLEEGTQVREPVSDRVERAVLDLLRKGEQIAEIEVDAHICRSLPGLLTPDRSLVRACLFSYAVEDTDNGLWFIREEDRAESRAKDREEIAQLLDEIGEYLGYETEIDDSLVWKSTAGEPIYFFSVQETAEFGINLNARDAEKLVLVIPGGRASLVAEKARRDPRIRSWLGARSKILKFRHVRRLAEDTTLNAENFLERMALDPPESHDSQLSLL